MTEGGAEATGIMETLNVTEQVMTDSVTCRVDLVMHPLDHEGLEEALHEHVVEAVASAVHGRNYTSGGKDLATSLGSVLDAVMAEAGPGSLPLDRHSERVDGDVRVQCLAPNRRRMIRGSDPEQQQARAPHKGRYVIEK